MLVGFRVVIRGFRVSEGELPHHPIRKQENMRFGRIRVSRSWACGPGEEVLGRFVLLARKGKDIRTCGPLSQL